jgi:hypothetical protein
MRPSHAHDRLPGIRRFEPLQERIKLLNRRWHRRGRARRAGSCAACERDILTHERAVHVKGELYHSDCAR